MYGIIPPKLAASNPAFSACRPGKSRGAEFRMPAIKLRCRDQHTYVGHLVSWFREDCTAQQKKREWGGAEGVERKDEIRPCADSVPQRIRAYCRFSNTPGLNSCCVS